MADPVTDIQELDYSVNLLQAILWQYTNATNLQGILNAKNAWYVTNHTDFWENWYTNVFNLATANDFGLSVWSIILGQSLFTSFIESTGIPYFGFGAYNQNFDGSNFASLNGGNSVYSTETSRLLLQLRYFQLVSSGTVPETNRMLAYVFANYGKAYLVDNHNMTQTYYFEFVLSAEISYMLNNTDVLPRPAGVSSTIIGL
jgi:hypothetical protein